MKLIIGLGNPGKKYEHSRHNLGFLVMEAFAKRLDVKFSEKSKIHAWIAEGHIGGEKIIIAKPATFMNLSGNAVQMLAAYYKESADKLWVLHDEIDLVFGKLRIQRKRSSAGHRGVQNIIDAIGTNDFYRFRVGIDSRTEAQKKSETNVFVMADFSSSDKKILKELIPRLVEMLINAIKTSPEKAMSVWGNNK
ncbi:MAG: aminoacyl-tRNA hydrolase [Candidatus Kerfeldbacteria bacterium RIFCSPLOWO2_01_FULL_48_11]|uniref:Peptidyl-tRNA hydrolase n=1 Tax=Candidatus Kerfeldbacteria bacterium RIFCSPLOWO2_01_FULL_48_11 TaxID=1798543 RepID=A0A1G2B309_9BACT|nr:MAG: Peptidyl-tRNA hydrolase [Parcubacteria group bacterium GW2011_GWA2_48_9]KKW16016.1 MAG: Peptidyl-tRNA hydrolase [Parcubacteria group bacterium GW2011_GWC2_49_9]OGY83029.1 MAG: aminoacyl-tRNA hydrolase [Candidatus Kerfeldbacteria bacterium RIFCSPLOWO2_01_FULL_48_11]